MESNSLKYKRILLKLSGEALMGEEDYGIDPKVINRIAEEIHQIHQLGVQVGIVIGGGNIFRGAGLAKSGIDRVTGDHMGMLATVMNSLALQNALEKQGIKVMVFYQKTIHSHRPEGANVQLIDLNFGVELFGNITGCNTG